MNKNVKQLLSMVLAFVMLINMLPQSALALEEDNSRNTVPVGTSESEDAYIIGEVVENRSEYSKEYVLSNGLHMATVYGEAVHYEENGEWKEIDNTLKSSGTRSEATYTNTAGPWNISFPQQLSRGRDITITKDGYTLSFSMSGELLSAEDEGVASASAEGNRDERRYERREMRDSNAQQQEIDMSQAKADAEYPETVPDKLYSRLEYEDIFDNTNVIYDLTSNQIKESVVIETYNEALRGYEYTLKVGQMVPVLTESGQIELYDKSGKNLIMVMPAPYLVDSAEEYSFDIAVELQNNGGGTYTLIYTLPQEWMADDSRQWPVILDPIIQANTNASNISDKCVFSIGTASPTLGVNKCGYSTNLGVVRFYLKYNQLPGLSSADVITSAAVRLYKCYGSSTAKCVEVHKVTETWEATTMQWADMAGFDTAVEDYAICKAGGAYLWDVTDIVRGWYEGENTGMMFKLPNSVEAAKVKDVAEFWSADYSTLQIIEKPTLMIMFRNNNGLESYWDYTSSSAGRAGTGYINNYTGNLVWIHDDIGFGGNRMPVSISHIYNVNDANDANDNETIMIGMGNGWRTNFNQRVYPCNNEDAVADYYVWEDSDGTSHYFYQDNTDSTENDTSYMDEDGLELTLTVATEATEDYKYCISDKYGNASYFDSLGRLIKQSNNQKTPSCITISYVESEEYKYLIQTITDGAGRDYNFTYSDGLLSRISYTGGGTEEISYVRFEYDVDRLIRIIDPDTECGCENECQCASVRYTYVADSDDATKYLLKSATDTDGYRLEYSYTATSEGMPARVESVSEHDGESHGGSLTITYGQNQTTFTDHNGNVQIMQFNNFGNTIAVMDDQGRSQYAQYARNNPDDSSAEAAAASAEGESETSTPKGNQLSASSKLQNTVGNMLEYGSFETLQTWTATAGSISYSLVSGTAYAGSKSLKIINSSSETAAGVISPSLQVVAGHTYTFSAYVKTDTATAYLALGDSTSAEVLKVNSDWTRLEVSYEAEETKTIYAYVMAGSAGTVYVDCVQVEKAVTASRYNLVENGDFRYSSSWSASAGRTSDSAAAPELDNTVYQMTGTPTATNRISQDVAVSGDGGDTYVLTGWAKGDSVPLDAYDTNPREFALIATFTYTDGATESQIVRFNPYVSNWQSAAGFIKADKAYSKITVELAYDYNMNSVVFDGIQLYKEEFGSQYTYDANGNVTTATDVQGGTTTYTYDSNQNLSSVTLPDNTELTYTYDDYHNVLTATTETGVLYEFTYDAYGNNTSVSIISGSSKITSRAAYENTGNTLKSTTDTMGNVTQYGYDPNTDMLLWVQYPEDDAASRTEYTYDDMYRLAKAEVTTDAGQTLSAIYTYDDDLLKTIQTPTTAYTFDYGAFSLRTSIKAGDHTLATYTYTNDRNNYLQALEYGNGDVVEYEYDTFGRVVKTHYYADDASTEPLETVTYQYDNNGALATVHDSATGITTTYYYDFAYRMMKYVESGNDYSHSVGYAYDEVNNLTSLVETINGTEHTTSYTYDDDNRVTMVRNGNTRRQYGYDSYGRTAGWISYYGTRPVLEQYFTYQSSSTKTTNRVATFDIVSNGFTAVFRYGYDKNGNITSIRNGTALVASYVYDSANQLIRENNQAAGLTWVWTYDNAGNIKSRTEYPYTTAAAPSGGETVSYLYDDEDGWGDLLTGYGTYTIDYDAIGNPIVVKDANDNILRSYTWRNGRELASLSENGTTWTYTYDANGMRTSRSNGTTTYEYIYNGSSLVQMTVGNDVLYFANGSVKFNNVQYYYVTNLQGDVIAILNSSGTAVVQYTYDAWGNVLSTTGSMASTLGTLNPIRYRGYVYDQESGLYYLQSRYYDPEVGRFINADALVSTGQGLLGNNMFAYCNNNPVLYADSDGYKPGDLFETMDEAARDAAFYINEQSIAENAEYGAHIYAIEETYKEKCYFQFSIFGFDVAIPYYKKVTNVYYTYDEPVKGTSSSVELGPPDNSMELVALFHTHAAYSANTNHSNDDFSTLDIQVTNYNRIPSYLATPNGTLRLYDPISKTNIVVYSDIPYDINHPER